MVQRESECRGKRARAGKERRFISGGIAGSAPFRLVRAAVAAGPGPRESWSGWEKYWLGVCWVCMLWPVWRRVVTSGCDVKLWRQPVMSLAAAIIESAGLPRALHVSRKGCGTQRTWSIRPERINLGLRHVFVSWFLWRYLNQEYQAEYFDWIFRPSMTISLAMSFINRVRGLKSMLSP